MKPCTWNDINEDALGPLAGRRVLHGKNITVARFRFDRGNEVAMHRHVNDQVTMVQTGSLRMVVGGAEMVLQAGDMVHVGPDVQHGNVALEDSVVIEIFSPVREDWLKADDSHLRQK
jgi:quercetin dioxygenase-like cupin family protein